MIYIKATFLDWKWVRESTFDIKMESLTHFHSKNVCFYQHYSYNLKVTALSIYQNFWIDTNLKILGLCHFKLKLSTQRVPVSDLNIKGNNKDLGACVQDKNGEVIGWL